MGLINGIQCDICGRRDLWKWTCGKLYIERWARSDGWKIGKQCRCPDCVRAKRQTVYKYNSCVNCKHNADHNPYCECCELANKWEARCS